MNFTFMELVDSLPTAWKKNIEANGSFTNNLLLNHHVTRKNNLLTLEKSNSREIYNVIINTIPNTSTSKRYFELRFTGHNLDWKLIYLPPRNFR